MQPPEPPPVPILATNVANTLSVFFSTPITPGPISQLNWAIRLANFNRDPIVATAVAPNRVDVTHLQVLPNPGPDVVSYSPPPFDVVGPGGPAVAFADFPIT